jgi:hypothetical protein
MKDDPAIKAVRDGRRRISESVDHDPRKLVEHFGSYKSATSIVSYRDHDGSLKRRARTPLSGMCR